MAGVVRYLPETIEHTAWVATAQNPVTQPKPVAPSKRDHCFEAYSNVERMTGRNLCRAMGMHYVQGLWSIGLD